MNNRQETGRVGEELAAAHLERQGYRIADRNWRCSLGELDIVAVTDGVVVAVEVKTRKSCKYGGPLEAITRPKRERLRLLAVEWMREHDMRAALRIDAIGIRIDDDGGIHLAHIRAIS